MSSISCGKLLGRILEVRVLDHDEIAGDFLEAAAQRRALARVRRLQISLIGSSRATAGPGSSRVPSFDPSSTMISSMRSGTARTRRMISSIVSSLVVHGHHDREQRIDELARRRDIRRAPGRVAVRMRLAPAPRGLDDHVEVFEAAAASRARA